MALILYLSRLTVHRNPMAPLTVARFRPSHPHRRVTRRRRSASRSNVSFATASRANARDGSTGGSPGRPRNVVVAPGGVAKLGNFDLSFIPHAPSQSLARTVRDHVDRRYVAPCLWEDPGDVVPASDVYSLGLVFYQLITGQPPRHDVAAVLAGKGPAIDAELLAAELGRAGGPNFMGDPAGAAEVIGRMCAPRRSDRYANLAEAVDDLAICEG